MQLKQQWTIIGRRMVLVYSDSATLDNTWIPLLKFKDPVEICHNINDFINHPSKKKLAFTMERMGPIYDTNGRKSINSCPWHLEGFEDKINLLSSVSQLVFSAEGEMHLVDLAPIWKKCSNKNIFWIMPGAANTVEMKDNIIFWGDWFDITTRIYKEVPDELTKFDYHYPKEKYFDALLGRVRPHRTFVYDAVNKSNYRHNFIMTYYNDCLDLKKFFKEKFIWDPDCELLPDIEIEGTHSEINFRGVTTAISRVIPTGIYNRTAYSIVAETNGKNGITFFTEKIAKPLIGKRLFVVFSGYKFLELLQSLGFKTFSNVIDESYDQIYDDQERFAAAFRQVKKLCETNQVGVTNKIKDVVEHNYKIIMETNWHHHMISQVQKKIDEL